MHALSCSEENCDVRDPNPDMSLTYDFSVSSSSFTINADSQAQLQNSFKLTAVPFGIPDYLPLGFLGLVVSMECLKKWKNQKKSTECDESYSELEKLRVSKTQSTQNDD